jgi:transposase
MKYSTDYKKSAIDYYKKVRNYVLVCKIFGCSRSSLIRWVNQDKLNNNFFNNKKVRYGGYKIKKIHIDFINKCLLENKTITIKQLKEYLMLKFSLNISHSHLSRVVKKIGFSLKKVKLEHRPKTRYGKIININNLLQEFYVIINKFELKDIICIDETSFNAFLIRKYGYSKKGTRCIIQTNNQNVFKKYTGIFAMTISGILSYTIYAKGGMNSDRLIEFLNKFLLEQKSKLIILDNASCHRTEIVKDLIQLNNNLLYTIPYNHRTQAIEGFFNVLKSKLAKKKGFTYEELCENIENVLKEIPQKTYQNLIWGCYFKPYKSN